MYVSGTGDMCPRSDEPARWKLEALIFNSIHHPCASSRNMFEMGM